MHWAKAQKYAKPDMYIVKEREAGAVLRGRQACHISYMVYKGICYLCYTYHVVL